MHRAHYQYAASGESEASLIGKHAQLIERTARRLASRTAGAVSSEDLWSAGALGLLDAARRFDPAQNVRFETFAEHRIKGAMLDEMRRMDHLPRRLRAQAEQVERARSRLGQKLQREPTADELATELQVGSEELETLLGVAMPHLSVLDHLPAEDDAADEAVARGELRRRLATAIEGLPERLQLVLSLHYVEGLTYREIAKILEVSEPRVCQLHADALNRVRGAVGPE